MAGVVIVVIAIFLVWSGRGINIGVINLSVSPEKKLSPIAGLDCEYRDRRPVAVMLASDPETRPLSGIGQADLVVEMPVTPNGITRMMAVYQCQTPNEIGSIRSARGDFIPLAGGFESLYAHWGGEYDALEQLDRRVIDNVDALKYEGTTFYRKTTIPRPHNGFSTISRIFDRAIALGYDLNKNFSGYLHSDAPPIRNLSNIANTVTLNYPATYNAVWTYDAITNSYLRARGGGAEVDRNTGEQVRAQVVIVMHTASGNIRGQYISVNTTGQGTAEVYQNGIRIDGTWKKDPTQLNSKLFFYDASGKEIPFVSGTIWIEIATTQ